MWCICYYIADVKGGYKMIILDGESLDLEQFIAVVRDKQKVALDEKAIFRVNKAHQLVEKHIQDNRVVYGINTGFGKLSDIRIKNEELSDLQKNLLLSHACGTGELFDNDVVRGMLLLRVNALIKGYSGIRIEVIEKLCEFLNKDLIPVVYSQGSLGASGDLVPLAHMALPLLGEGEVIYQNERQSAKKGLQKANIKPLDRLEAKEGLALINGTQAMVSVGALATYDAFKTFKHAIISATMSFEALKGICDVFDERIHNARPHHGQLRVAGMMRHTIKDSKNVSHQGDDHIQDAYSLRCIPQVHGATLDALEYALNKIEIEMNSATDNPLLFTKEEDVLSAGNFHGQPVAMVFDYLAIAVHELANISERRLERMVNTDINKMFPPFLAKYKGRNSGFMIVQYVAASLVSENKVLTHPASVDSIPSSANKEDHVSMGTIAARKLAKVMEHTRKVIALEMFTAAQALDFQGLNACGSVCRKAYDIIRSGVPFIEEDTMMQPYMDFVETCLIEDKITDEVLEAWLWKKR